MLKEQHPFWSAWSRVVTTRTWFVIVLALGVTALLGYQAWRTPKDLSFTGILNESDVEMHHFKDTIDTFGANSMLVLLLEGPPEELAAIIPEIEEAVLALPMVVTVTPPADPEWLIERSPWIWPRGMFDNAMRQLGNDDPPPALLNAINGADTAVRNALRPVDDAALVGVGLDRSPLDMAMGGNDFFEIEAVVNGIIADSKRPVTVGYTGLVAAAAQDQRSVMRRIQILSPITLTGVLILLMGVERRLSRVLLAGMSLSFAVLIAFGLTGLTLGRLSITVTFFGVLLLGLGIDFGIHLLVSLRDARSHGKSPEDAVRHGIRFTASAIAIGGMSTALAFGTIVFVPEAGARDMGFAALYGLLAALVLMLTLLPASWLVLERRSTGTTAPPRFVLPGLKRIVGFSVQRPVLVLAACTLLTLACLTGIPKYSLEPDLEKIISRDVRSFDVDKRLEEIFGVSPVNYIAPIESLDQAREWKPALLAMEDISAASSPADVILPDAQERYDAAVAALAALPGENHRGELYERFARAVDAGLITLENIPISLANGLIGSNGELAMSVVPKKNVMDAFVLADQIDAIREVAPTATGMPVIIKMAVIGRRDYIPIMIPTILCVVTIVLIGAFRNLRDVILALLPVLMGTGISFGLFLWCGFQVSALTGIVIPVILGLGVDDGIHVVERFRQYQFRTAAIIHEAVEGVGRAIFLTTATTCVSFISLLFTNHPGLESISWFMLIGVPTCFLTSVTALPAAAVLWRDRAPDRMSDQESAEPA